MDRPAGTSTGRCVRRSAGVRGAATWPGDDVVPGATGHSITLPPRRDAGAAEGNDTCRHRQLLAPVARQGVGYGWPVESVAGSNGDRPVAVRPRPAALALKRTLDATLAAAGLVLLSPAPGRSRLLADPRPHLDPGVGPERARRLVRRALVAAARRAQPVAHGGPDDPAGRNLQGHHGRLGPVSKRSVLLTCAGLRVDVV